MRLLKYLGLSESDEVFVELGDPPCYKIRTENERGVSIETVQIPFGDLSHQKELSLHWDSWFGENFFLYPNDWAPRSARRIYAKNLRILLFDFEAHLKAIEDARNQTEDDRLLRIKLEFGELTDFNERSDL